MIDSADTVIYAAGAVLWRFDTENRIEIGLIHRPRYDDWSLPKGKLDPNETMIGCAYREVVEETGYSAVFGPELGHATYVADGANKLVKYWSAQAVGAATGKPNPQEVDQIMWLSPADARKKLTLDDIQIDISQDALIKNIDILKNQIILLLEECAILGMMYMLLIQVIIRYHYYIGPLILINILLMDL